MYKYEHVDRYWHVYIKMYRVMTRKQKCHMASNSYKIHDVEKNVFGAYKSIYTAKKDF